MNFGDVKVTCPKCQHKFYETIIISINSRTLAELPRPDKMLSPTRECPKCGVEFDIYEEGDLVPVPIKYPLKVKMKRFFYKFLP